MAILRSAPMGYFITFHTYGSWLPGDPRGSVDASHRDHGAGYAPASPARQAAASQRLRNPPVELRVDEQALVLRTIQDVCALRGWLPYAIHVRINHVHAVVRSQHPPERVMTAFKAWATRRLVEAGRRAVGDRVWARHGSTRYLWRQDAVGAACAYVMEGQGEGRAGAWWAGGAR